ncbi:MAG: hypothetical protein J6Y20_06605 [Lachnospiraceae bacterium]|nr:hypothetical protein [Lachnospiraceae bacterium]
MSGPAATIISSLISGALAIVVCIININANHNKLVSELEKRDAIHDERLKQLKESVDKHNQVIERTYALETSAKVLAEKIDVANHRISDLEAITRSDLK